jgi:hypothetical protein
MFSVAAFAEEPAVYTVKFYVEDKATGENYCIRTVYVADGAEMLAKDIPDEPLTPMNPEENYKYEFLGWKSSVDGERYYKGTMNQYVTSDIDFVAEFDEKEVKKTQSFWNFIESIFERINRIFQYFAKIFDFGSEE